MNNKSKYSDKKGVKKITKDKVIFAYDVALINIVRNFSRYVRTEVFQKKHV